MAIADDANVPGRATADAARTSRKPLRLFRNLTPKIAMLPMIFTAVVVFLGGTLWTVVYSFTNSGLLPRLNWAGLATSTNGSGRRANGSSRSRTSPSTASARLIGTLVIGFTLAALLDRKIRFENTFRTIFLYPFAPQLHRHRPRLAVDPEPRVRSAGHRARAWAGTSFTFDPLNNPDIVMYGLLIAGLWQGTGLIMCIMLAGLRGIDEDIWKAARVDGIGRSKTYIRIIIPMMRPVFVTALVLIAAGIVKLYDLVVAQTSGGPGHQLRGAGEIRHDRDVRRPEPGPGLRRLDHDAADASSSS